MHNHDRRPYCCGISNMRFSMLIKALKSGYNMYRGCTQIDYQKKHYNINQKDEGT